MGRPVTTNEERQEVMGTAWEQVPLMKGSGIVGGGVSQSPLRGFGAGQAFTLNYAVGWPWEESLSFSICQVALTKVPTF